MKKITHSLRTSLLTIAVLVLSIVPFMGMQTLADSVVTDAAAAMTFNTGESINNIKLNPGVGAAAVAFAPRSTGENICSVSPSFSGKTDEWYALDVKMLIPNETYRVALVYSSVQPNRYYDSTTKFALQAYINGASGEANAVNAKTYGVSSQYNNSSYYRKQVFMLHIPATGMKLTLSSGEDNKQIQLKADTDVPAEGQVHYYTLPDESGISEWLNATRMKEEFAYQTVVGWSVKASAGEKDILFAPGEKLDWYKVESLTDTPALYAVWGKRPMSVELHANDGSGRKVTVETTAQSAYRPDNTTFTAENGYIFKGWAETADGTPKTSFNLTKDKSGYRLYAVWEKKADVIPETEKTDTGTDTDKTDTEKTDTGTDTGKTDTVVVKGTSITDETSEAVYIVTDAAAHTVAYAKPARKRSTVVIPAAITYQGQSYKVTAIQKKAFWHDKKLKTVVIGKYVTTIGSKAFSTCTKLSKVTMGKRVTTIGKFAFYKCTALKKITIPSRVAKIESRAFQGCSKLKSITIKSKKLSKENIGSKAFSGINSKAVIKVPSTMRTAYKAVLAKKGVKKAMTVR